MGWTEERIARLTELNRLGLSARQIAEALGGVTRCAVIGKRFRLGLKLPGYKAPPVMRTKADAARQNGLNNGLAKRLKARTEPNSIPRLPLPKPPLHEPLSRRLALLDLTSTTCRWPHGTPGIDLHFCGHRASVERPYCPFHQALSRGAGTQSERRASDPSDTREAA